MSGGPVVGTIPNSTRVPKTCLTNYPTNYLTNWSTSLEKCGLNSDKVEDKVDDKIEIRWRTDIMGIYSSVMLYPKIYLHLPYGVHT
jgi:hypothetical protein